jgi:hypothetical protein
MVMLPVLELWGDLDRVRDSAGHSYELFEFCYTPANDSRNGFSKCSLRQRCDGARHNQLSVKEGNGSETSHGVTVAREGCVVTHAVVVRTEVDPSADLAIAKWNQIGVPLMRATAPGFQRAIMMRDDGGNCIFVAIFDSKQNAELWSSIQNDPEESVGVYAILSDME